MEVAEKGRAMELQKQKAQIRVLEAKADKALELQKDGQWVKKQYFERQICFSDAKKKIEKLQSDKRITDQTKKYVLYQIESSHQKRL